MINKYIVNQNRNIGTVIFIVEGGRENTGGTELRLLKSIFADFLGYRVDELRRGTDEFIAHGSNPYSRVFALNLPKNQLTQLTEESLDKLYERLRDDFKVKPEDCPVFFIYDRDYKSYHPNELFNPYIKKYTDPYSNDYGDQGQLLLSYPCIESYILSLILDDVYKNKYLLGKDLKKDKDIIQFLDFSNNINETCLIHAVEEMNNGLLSFNIESYDIDNLAPTLIKMYEEQQKTFKSENGFPLFSFLSMALLELGIIQPIDE